jgi:hypothetical protein
MLNHEPRQACLLENPPDIEEWSAAGS